MWKQLLEFGKRLAFLVQKTQQHEEDIKTVQQAIKEQDERIDRLAEIVQRLAFELERDRDMAGRDRENLLLRLENSLLRFERRLPSGRQRSTVRRRRKTKSERVDQNRLLSHGSLRIDAPGAAIRHNRSGLARRHRWLPVQKAQASRPAGGLPSAISWRTLRGGWRTFGSGVCFLLFAAQTPSCPAVLAFARCGLSDKRRK
jgi:hypothetical protein